MAVTIPLRNDLPHFELQTVLDGTTFGLELRWNDRESSWYASLLDVDGEPIYVGQKVVIGWPLFKLCVDARMFPGRLLAIDTSGADAPPGLADLGGRVLLVYVEEAELEAVGA